MNNTISRGVIRALGRSGLMPRQVTESIKRNSLRSSHGAYLCAKYIVGGRWPEAEERIAKDPRSAFYYALNILKGRWPEAEETLAQSPVWFQDYWTQILKGHWPKTMTEGLHRARALWGENPEY